MQWDKGGGSDGLEPGSRPLRAGAAPTCGHGYDAPMIPVVDLQRSAGTAGLLEGLQATGFVELAGHGLDLAALEALRAAADQFFDLPEAQKGRYSHPEPLANRGFRARGSEALSYSLGKEAPPDLFESFNAGRDAVEAWTDLVQPTPWPDGDVPDYRPAALAALRSFEQLGARLDAVLGAAIGIPDLAARSTRGPDMLACIDYRPDPSGDERVVAARPESEGDRGGEDHQDEDPQQDRAFEGAPHRGHVVEGRRGGGADLLDELDRVVALGERDLHHRDREHGAEEGRPGEEVGLGDRPTVPADERHGA